MSRFQFVADHQDTFEVKRLCKGVEVGRASFYAWLAGAEARAQRRPGDDALAERIRRVHQVDRAYGAPRVTAELNDPTAPVAGAEAGELPIQVPERVNHNRLARVMREHRIAGLRLRRKVRTTIAHPDVTPVPDLLKRDFTAPQPNQRYVGNIQRRRRHLMSATHSWSEAPAVNCRSTRSGRVSGPLPGIVVRGPFAR